MNEYLQRTIFDNHRTIIGIKLNAVLQKGQIWDIMQLLAGLLLSLVIAQALSLDPKIVEVSGYQRLRSYNRSTLYQVKADGSDYVSAPYLLQLVGGRYGEQ